MTLLEERCSKKLWLLSILVLQNSLTTLVGRYTRTAAANPGDMYNINHFVLAGEVGKLLISLILEVATQKRLSSFHTYIVQHPGEMLKMAIPAMLYWGSNTLLYVALSNLTVPIFQVAYQGKLVITALVSVCMLSRSYVCRQWLCLVVISVCVALIAIEGNSANNAPSSSTSSSSPSSTDKSSNVTIGLLAILIACFLSAFAGVYFEKVLKSAAGTAKNAQPPPSLWMRNIQLAFFSILVAFSQATWNRQIGDKAFFHGFHSIVWCQVLLFAVGGLLVAAVIKHTDNVLKGLATGMSVLVATAGSMVFYGTPLTPTFAVCSTATVVAVYYFSNDTSPTCDGIIQEQFQASGSAVSANKTALFPANWNSTTTALNALRSIVKKILENHVHEATHIMYDLRTTLGNCPVKYLEIGSYTGLSAMLMLQHPLKTSVTLVDPCTLPKTHFKGTVTQEQTIRKNLNGLCRTGICGGCSPWELRVGYSPEALPNNETFDIVFIDGDHSTNGVWQDYMGTVDLLRPGGFMVFDDYLDWKYSPEVRGAVDDIARRTDLIPIGTPQNIHGIHPATNQSFINEYIFQKMGKFKPQFESGVKNDQPILGIITATYRRPDGSTPPKLERLWNMLQSQSYTNWNLYMTGDHYDNDTEWKSLPFYTDPRARLNNLPEPGERGKLPANQLWNNAGATAMNDAIDRVLADGHQWTVHLDDDDTWDSDHLQNVVDGIRTGATFVMTECQYQEKYLPNPGKIMTHISKTNLPKPCQVIHSATAWNAAKISTRYKISPNPADAYMWQRIIYDDNFYPAFVPVKSCHHLEEKGDGGSVIVLRKFGLNDRDPPPGWYTDADEYFTLASDTFPPDLSKNCIFVVGPSTGPPEGYPYPFKQLTEEQKPYHIRVVETFAGLPVWQKVG
eukprot:scaffold2917_cov191-Amphora_coffeaeformis.AAC.51